MIHHNTMDEYRQIAHVKQKYDNLDLMFWASLRTHELRKSIAAEG